MTDVFERVPQKWRMLIRGEAVRNGAGFGRDSTNLSRRLGFSRYSFIILVLRTNYQRSIVLGTIWLALVGF